MMNVKYDALLGKVREQDTGNIPDASETTKGKIQLATETETKAGTDTAKAVTPATLKATIDARIGAIDEALDTLNGEEI